MIDRLLNLFKDQFAQESAEAPYDDHAIQLAAAALMLEVARSDTNKQEIELETIGSLLDSTFELNPDEIHELISAAAHKVDEAHDLYQFTQMINDHYTYEEKKQLVYAMWLVAFADGHIESFEDHIIRRVAGLIHLAHEDFIQMKLRARDNQ